KEERTVCISSILHRQGQRVYLSSGDDLDKEGIAPILKLLGDFHPIVLKMLPSLLPPEMAGLAGFLEPLIDMLFITWPECALLVQSFDLGLDLVPQN
ncbi:hypothetical protein AAH131_20905, partial [Bacteroides ovatus]